MGENLRTDEQILNGLKSLVVRALAAFKTATDIPTQFDFWSEFDRRIRKLYADNKSRLFELQKAACPPDSWSIPEPPKRMYPGAGQPMWPLLDARIKEFWAKHRHRFKPVEEPKPLATPLEKLLLASSPTDQHIAFRKQPVPAEVVMAFEDADELISVILRSMGAGEVQPESTEEIRVAESVETLPEFKSLTEKEREIVVAFRRACGKGVVLEGPEIAKKAWGKESTSSDDRALLAKLCVKKILTRGDRKSGYEIRNWPRNMPDTT